VPRFSGVDSEVGRLRAVIVHRPGAELKRWSRAAASAAVRREQWDDAGNLLVLAPGLVVSHERNVATHARLERIGIEVITVPGSELCGSRGGPRSLCCPVSRDPAPLPGDSSTEL
jgi:arginine deiminase